MTMTIKIKILFKKEKKLLKKTLFMWKKIKKIEIFTGYLLDISQCANPKNSGEVVLPEILADRH